MLFKHQSQYHCDTSSTISYLAHIEPILSTSCGANNSCHNIQGSSGGVVLENYAGVNSSVVNGKFLSSIIWDGHASQMPKNSPNKLRNCFIVQIQKWIIVKAVMAPLTPVAVSN